jgi:hypothetical protein
MRPRQADRMRGSGDDSAPHFNNVVLLVDYEEDGVLAKQERLGLKLAIGMLAVSSAMSRRRSTSPLFISIIDVPAKCSTVLL